MGVFIYRSDISANLYDAAYAALGRFKGGLALATVLACGGFSAVCGSTLATVATMSKVAMPQMKAYNYSDKLAAGTIAAGGTLGIMIPPSVPLVIYGITAEVDIGILFIAGILPGIMLVTLFLLTVSVMVRLDPDAAPDAAELEDERKRKAIRGTAPVLALFVIVLGGIYGGMFTPTEASGIGATGAAVIALLRGHLRTLAEWRSCLVEAAMTTAKIFLVLFGAVVFTQFINLSGMPYDLLDFVDARNMNGAQLVLFICLIALLMGMVFETIRIIVLLVPVFLPALYALDIDMVWFGIIVVLVIEIGLITPPIGMKRLCRQFGSAHGSAGRHFSWRRLLCACAGDWPGRRLLHPVNRNVPSFSRTIISMLNVKNIFFIMADQLRWDCLSYYGHPHLKAPNIDRLTVRGVRFDRAYVQSTVCDPSRASF